MNLKVTVGCWCCKGRKPCRPGVIYSEHSLQAFQKMGKRGVSGTPTACSLHRPWYSAHYLLRQSGQESRRWEAATVGGEACHTQWRWNRGRGDGPPTARWKPASEFESNANNGRGSVDPQQFISKKEEPSLEQMLTHTDAMSKCRKFWCWNKKHRGESDIYSFPSESFRLMVNILLVRNDSGASRNKPKCCRGRNCLSPSEVSSMTFSVQEPGKHIPAMLEPCPFHFSRNSELACSTKRREEEIRFLSLNPCPVEFLPLHVPSVEAACNKCQECPSLLQNLPRRCL